MNELNYYNDYNMQPRCMLILISLCNLLHLLTLIKYMYIVIIRLKKLYLYGVGGTCMRDIALVQRERTGLRIEM